MFCLQHEHVGDRNRSVEVRDVWLFAYDFGDDAVVKVRFRGRSRHLKLYLPCPHVSQI
jgi:hypothetical protein